MTVQIDPFATANEPDYLADLVGEGKKYSDPKALAKATFHAQKHIETLETELANLRTQSQNGASMEQLLAAIKGQNENEGQPLVNNVTTPELPDFQSLIAAEIAKNESERRAAENYAQSVSRMNEVWGADADKKLNEAASSLGVSVKFLQDMAKQSAVGFTQLLGLDKDRSAPGGTSVPTSTVTLQGNKSKDRTWKYYQEMKQTNRKLYDDPATKVQLNRDALRLGEAFFD